jgi:hypothetical protein
MAETIYVLCSLTSVACALLLLRGYARSGVRLLLWSAICFVGLAANNVLLFVDLVLIPERDLGVARLLAALVGLTVLVIGLVWESD